MISAHVPNNLTENDSYYGKSCHLKWLKRNRV